MYFKKDFLRKYSPIAVQKAFVWETEKNFAKCVNENSSKRYKTVDELIKAQKFFFIKEYKVVMNIIIDNTRNEY